jgi:F-type H+-transporting ATPase subunit b
MELLSALGLDLKIFVAQLLNFVILGFILYKLGYKPILKFVKERTDKIEQGVKEADEAKTALASAKQDQAKIMAAAKVEAQALLDKAKVQAVTQGQQLIDRSKAEAQKVVEKAKHDIRLEHDKMVADAKHELAGIVLLASEKLLREKMSTATDRAFVEKTLAELNK